MPTGGHCCGVSTLGSAGVLHEAELGLGEATIQGSVSVLRLICFTLEFFAG